MIRDRWERIQELFQNALEQGPGERTHFIETACARDGELLAEVQALLDSHKAMGSFFEEAVDDSAQTLVQEDDSASWQGKVIGPYQILRKLGEGGIGAVYLGDRIDEEFRRQVAIKIVKRGMDTEDILRRFRNERQILATLDHPNIAKLFDGGTTEDGLPYFVMEYIDGVRIDEYCDAQHLSTRERLRLFSQVCSAVQFAHQNLIVHRDLKPGNILVTADGTPKLLDFGIAKLLNPDFSLHEVAATGAGRHLMSPAYASPEQVLGEVSTTATDVYSLGVVLYELLTGHRPYRIHTRLQEEIERLICKQQPERPSSVIQRREELYDGHTRYEITPEAISAVRDGRLAHLQRNLSGDLDWIVMKALEKEATRRYATAAELGADLGRHLNHEPVSARPPTRSYRLKKFVVRHRGPVAAGMTFLLFLLAALTTITFFYFGKEQALKSAQKRFNEVREIANRLIFDIYDEIETLPGATHAREVVVSTALQYLDSLREEAGELPELQKEVAEGYLRIGDVQGNPGNPSLLDTEGALVSYEKALTLFQELSSSHPENQVLQRDVATAHTKIGEVLAAARQPGEAMTSHLLALEIREQLHARSPEVAENRRDLARSYNRIAGVHLRQRKHAESLQY
ncbi:MAG: serine/threonine-protein kinase, partial [Planctomycetota bacterium]